MDNFVSKSLQILEILQKAAKDGSSEVATVAICDGKSILMGKRRDSGRYTLPGGHLDKGEEKIEGAVREVFEEAGIRIDPKDLKFLTSEKVTTHSGKTKIIHAYRYEHQGERPTTKNDPDKEVERWEWIDCTDGLPEKVKENLHSPKNILLQEMGYLEKFEGIEGSEKELAKADEPHLKLTHYSPTPGLKEIDPSKMGSSGVQSGGQYKSGLPETKTSFFYREGAKPESLVTQGAKSKYESSIHPEHLYDLGEDKHGIVKDALASNGGAWNTDLILSNIKNKGFKGVWAPTSENPNINQTVQLFHPHPIHNEEPIQKADGPKELIPSHHMIFTPENPMHPTKGQNPSIEDVANHLNSSGESAQIIEGHYGSPERSIMVAHPKNVGKIFQMARDFGQDSLIHSKNGQHELHYLNGDNAGKFIQGQGTNFYKDKPSDNFSTIETEKGPVHFQHNLNFDKSEQEPLMKPYRSDAQRRWAHSPAGKKALGGETAVHHWDQATKGKKLPEKVSKDEKPHQNENSGPKYHIYEKGYRITTEPMSVHQIGKKYNKKPHQLEAMGMRLKEHKLGKSEDLKKAPPLPFLEHNPDAAPLTNPDESPHHKKIKEVNLPNGLIYKQYANNNSKKLTEDEMDGRTGRRTHALFSPEHPEPLAIMDTAHESNAIAPGGMHPHKVDWVEVNNDFKGKGLGKQLYLATTVHGTKKLTSDSRVSPHATEAWKSFKGLPGLGGNIGRTPKPGELLFRPGLADAYEEDRHQLYVRDPKALDHNKMFPKVNLFDKLAASEKKINLDSIRKLLETPDEIETMDIPEHLQIQWATPYHRWSK